MGGMLELGDVIGYLAHYNLAEVSRQTGVKYHVLCKMVNGTSRNIYDPRYSDVKRLSNFLKGLGHTHS